MKLVHITVAHINTASSKVLLHSYAQHIQAGVTTSTQEVAAVKRNQTRKYQESCSYLHSWSYLVFCPIMQSHQSLVSKLASWCKLLAIPIKQTIMDIITHFYYTSVCNYCMSETRIIHRQLSCNSRSTCGPSLPCG